MLEYFLCGGQHTAVITLRGSAVSLGALYPNLFDRHETVERMRINKSTSHAVRILVDCAKAEGHLIKVADIASRLDITQQNAFKIVHLLSKAGFLVSARGRHGGVKLARPAVKISIGEVVRAIEGMGSEREEVGEADLHRIVDNALDAFVAVLDQHTLEDMVHGTHSPIGGEPGGRTGKGSAARGATAAARTRRTQQSASSRLLS
ncbi:Rrf2 family transcriptional regulator [Hyphomicrobium sulfonivorans]|nr:Rrf2 family transcriptional regulator [Hyphomicrobium sulfonivorans]